MPPPSPSLFRLDGLVHTYPPGFDTDNVQGRVLTSGVKQAFGFRARQDADSVVRGLELEAELAGATGLSFLILRGGPLYTGIHAVDRNLILIATAFPEVHSREVFLIYDDIDRSLHMIPSMPRTYPPVRLRTYHVLIARRHDDDRSYALVFPGTERVSLSDEGEAQRQDVLFVSPSSSTSPWQTTKKANFPDHLRADNSPFYASEVFSSRGRGYWVDLLCGVMYCECADVLSDDIDCVDIHSFDLPVECQKYSGCKEDIPEARAFRAMGPVGDSIKFVSIDGYLELVALEDRKLTVWRLMEDMNWAVEYELKLASLWEGVEFRGNFVPRDMAPMYPFLSMHEDHVIYFALGDYIQDMNNCSPKDPRRMLRVDLHSKTFNCTELSDSQRSSMASHLVVSSNAEGKLLGLSS